jgi:hypothetical protein
MPHVVGRKPNGSVKPVFWFVLLWILGVVGMALLALPFHLLVAWAKA